MIYRYFLFSLFVFSNSPQILNPNNYDLTIVGSMNFYGSLSRISVSVIDLLKNDLKINYINTIEFLYQDLPPDVYKIISKHTNTTAGKVALYTDVLWLKFSKYNNLYQKVPSSKIKIAYSMVESTAIPKQWTEILNNNFDAVVVPDKFYVDVYRNSGVKIPVFVIPIGLYIENLLNKPEKKSNINRSFVFGCSAVGWERKNLALLIEAFARAFKNSNNIFLKIHSKCDKGIAALEKIIKQNKYKNIILINSKLKWSEYINLFSSFDCYVLLSKGEGFSITPREAMALGIPCIISNNTAHKTICESGFVYSVPSDIKEPSYYEVFDQHCGVHFNCKIEDVVFALKEVHRNYNFYFQKAMQGRKWVSKYLNQNLKNKYLNLIKPNKLILGNENKITDEYMMTSSLALYNKYLKIKNL